MAMNGSIETPTASTVLFEELQGLREQCASFEKERRRWRKLFAQVHVEMDDLHRQNRLFRRYIEDVPQVRLSFCVALRWRRLVAAVSGEYTDSWEDTFPNDVDKQSCKWLKTDVEAEMDLHDQRLAASLQEIAVTGASHTTFREAVCKGWGGGSGSNDKYARVVDCTSSDTDVFMPIQRGAMSLASEDAMIVPDAGTLMLSTASEPVSEATDTGVSSVIADMQQARLALVAWEEQQAAALVGAVEDATQEMKDTLDGIESSQTSIRGLLTAVRGRIIEAVADGVSSAAGRAVAEQSLAELQRQHAQVLSALKVEAENNESASEEAVWQNSALKASQKIPHPRESRNRSPLRRDGVPSRSTSPMAVNSKGKRTEDFGSGGRTSSQPQRSIAQGLSSGSRSVPMSIHQASERRTSDKFRGSKSHHLMEQEGKAGGKGVAQRQEDSFPRTKTKFKSSAHRATPTTSKGGKLETSAEAQPAGVEAGDIFNVPTCAIASPHTQAQLNYETTSSITDNSNHFEGIDEQFHGLGAEHGHIAEANSFNSISGPDGSMKTSESTLWSSTASITKEPSMQWRSLSEAARVPDVNWPANNMDLNVSPVESHLDVSHMELPLEHVSRLQRADDELHEAMDALRSASQVSQQETLKIVKGLHFQTPDPLFHSSLR